MANLPYISHDACVGLLKHLPSDNFCGGSIEGNYPNILRLNQLRSSKHSRKSLGKLISASGVRSGDSGGGFVFKYENRYFLRNIVSSKDLSDNSSISAFTDVSVYINWIRINT